MEGGHRGDMRVKAGTGAMRTGWESSGKHEMETSALGLVNLHYRWQAQSTLPRPIFNRSQIYRFVGCPRPHVGYPKWNHCPCQFPRTRSGSIRRLSDSGVRSCLASVLAATSILLEPRVQYSLTRCQRPSFSSFDPLHLLRLQAGKMS